MLHAEPNCSLMDQVGHVEGVVNRSPGLAWFHQKRKRLNDPSILCLNTLIDMIHLCLLSLFLSSPKLRLRAHMLTSSIVILYTNNLPIRVSSCSMWVARGENRIAAVCGVFIHVIIMIIVVKHIIHQSGRCCLWIPTYRLPCRLYHYFTCCLQYIRLDCIMYIK